MKFQNNLNNGICVRLGLAKLTAYQNKTNFLILTSTLNLINLTDLLIEVKEKLYFIKAQEQAWHKIVIMTAFQKRTLLEEVDPIDRTF